MLLNEKICGLGDPENLLYLPDKMTLLSRMIQYGGNGLYCIACSGWGSQDFQGNPFKGGDPNQGLDPVRMADWQAFMGAANEKGIWTFLFLYDDNSQPFGSYDHVTAAEDQYLQQLVAYFGPLDRLVWVIGEEYIEAIAPARAREIARRLNACDQGRHTIGIHQHSGLSFNFGNDSYIKLHMMQWIDADRANIYYGLTQAVSEARGRYQIILAESTHPGYDWYLNGDTMRRKNWAVLMSGATGVLVYTRGNALFLNDQDLKWLGYQNTWTRIIPRFTEMIPMPWTARHATEWVLKDVDEDRWLLYTTRPGVLGAGEFSPGEYDVSWFDCVSGGGLNEKKYLCGWVELNRMPGIGQECSVFIRK